MKFLREIWTCFIFAFAVLNDYTYSVHCNKGFFKLGPATECHPWLTCEDIIDLESNSLIGYGAVKQVYQSTWQKNAIAIVHINKRDYLSDFLHGFEMLKSLGPSKYIVQLIGFCLKDFVYLTEYHPLGNSININKILLSDNMLALRRRFELCVNYVKILEFLHNSPLGTRVMCDSSTLNKTLEQYLISSSLNLILNDVDALPEVGRKGIICGHKELQGSFVAPEQRWPYFTQVFDEKRMAPYDEKVDIWKIPAVCNYYLGKSEAAKAFRFHVYPIHKQCREKSPRNRPSASEVLQFYESLLQEYFKDELINLKEEL